MPGQNIFITGATGKIGKFLLEEINVKDNNVTLLCRKKPEGGEAGFKYVTGDLLKQDSYSDALKDVDTVVHMAAVSYESNEQRYYTVNADATLHLIEMCKEHDVKRFIYISTWAISQQGGHYSRSKYIAEGHVKQSGLDWVILRLSEVYGVHAGQGVDMIMETIGKYPFIPVMGHGRYNIAPVHVRDVITILTRVIEDGDIKQKTYDIIGPEIFTFNEFIDKIMYIKGIRKMKIHIPISICRLMIKVMSVLSTKGELVTDHVPRLLGKKHGDITGAKEDLDYSPVRLDEGNY